METFDALSKRTSVREYKTTLIEKSLLEQLVDAGRRAPTARAIEPWEFVVVTRKETLQKLGDIADHGRFIKDAAACIVVYCKDTKYYLEDGAAATENILIAAADLGLGACWVAGDKKGYVKDVGALLEAKSDLKLISLISLGWRKDNVEQVKNRNLQDVLHWENF